jgi:hypothetical protein
MTHMESMQNALEKVIDECISLEYDTHTKLRAPLCLYSFIQTYKTTGEFKLFIAKYRDPANAAIFSQQDVDVMDLSNYIFPIVRDAMKRK